MAVFEDLGTPGAGRDTKAIRTRGTQVPGAGRDTKATRK